MNGTSVLDAFLSSGRRRRVVASEEIPEPKPKAKRVVKAAVMETAHRHVRQMMQTGEWGGAAGRHYVALYEISYEIVYGIPSVEMDGGARAVAGVMAGAMLRKHFAGDEAAMAMFVRWTWEREAGRDKWRRENGRDGFRIGYRLQFGTSLLADYQFFLRSRELPCAGTP